MPTTTIDSTTKINLTIVCTLVAAIVGVAVYLSTLNSNVVGLAASLKEVKSAIEANTQQQAASSREIGIVQALLSATDARIVAIERDVGELRRELRAK